MAEGEFPARKEKGLPRILDGTCVLVERELSGRLRMRTRRTATHEPCHVFMKATRHSVTSSTLTVALALKDFLNDNTSWKVDLPTCNILVEEPWNDSPYPLWKETCRRRGLTLADHSDGDKVVFYPFLWRVMRLDGYQRVLNKHMFDFDSPGVYYFLNFHTSPQSAVHFRAA